MFIKYALTSACEFGENVTSLSGFGCDPRSPLPAGPRRPDI